MALLAKFVINKLIFFRSKKERKKKERKKKRKIK